MLPRYIIYISIEKNARKLKQILHIELFIGWKNTVVPVDQNAEPELVRLIEH